MCSSATNIGASALILLVAFYIAETVEFSSLPAIILMVTLFRLAIRLGRRRGNEVIDINSPNTECAA
jgi:type III secretory pathway component EscV